MCGYSNSMTKTNTDYTAETMTTPPECQGQIVTYSYGTTEGGVLRRVFDASDRTSQWYRADWEDVCECAQECDCWDPINEEPAIIGSWVLVR